MVITEITVFAQAIFHNIMIYSISISTGAGAGNGTNTRVLVLYYYLLLPIITSLSYIRSVDTAKNWSGHILLIL